MTEDQIGALVSGLLLAGGSYGVYRVTAAAAAGRIPVNHGLGLRTPSTMRSQETWQVAHESALPLIRPLCLAAVVAAVAGAVAGSWPPAGQALVLTAAGLLLLGTVAGGVKGHRAAKRAHAARPAGDG